jgi:hypothetical protein
MSDIIVGLGIILLVSAALTGVALWLTRRLPLWSCRVLVALTLLGIFLYIHYLWDSLLLAKLLPFSNLIVLGNWFLPATAFLGGLAWGLIPGARVRRTCYIIALWGIGLYAVTKPLWGSPPICKDRWEQDVCIQTAEKSCSAACAATVLSQHGIPATEQELAALCLTRNGTMWQGLYRGLKKKTNGTGWDVEVFAGDFNSVLSRAPGPIILAVGLPDGPVDPIYEEQYGWKRGEWHSVIFFDAVDAHRVEMGEPTPGVGREQWSMADLQVLWRGRGMRLVRR